MWSLLDVHTKFGLSLVQLVLLSQQPEEQLPVLPVLPIPNTVELPTQIMGWKSTFISKTTNFSSPLPYLFSPDCFPPRWNSRMSADESWWPWTRDTGDISFITFWGLGRTSQGEWHKLGSPAWSTRGTGIGFGSEHQEVASALGFRNFAFCNHFICFIFSKGSSGTCCKIETRSNSS